MTFHSRLRQLRQQHKLTQGELAEVLHLKPTAISNYESKRNEPSFDKLIALSDYFDVSCDYLLGVSDTYLPVRGEVLDKDIVDFFNLYQTLSDPYKQDLIEFGKYLLYKQEKDKQ